MSLSISKAMLLRRNHFCSWSVLWYILRTCCCVMSVCRFFCLYLSSFNEFRIVNICFTLLLNRFPFKFITVSLNYFLFQYLFHWTHFLLSLLLSHFITYQYLFYWTHFLLLYHFIALLLFHFVSIFVLQNSLSVIFITLSLYYCFTWLVLLFHSISVYVLLNSRFVIFITVSVSVLLNSLSVIFITLSLFHFVSVNVIRYPGMCFSGKILSFKISFFSVYSGLCSRKFVSVSSRHFVSQVDFLLTIFIMSWEVF